MKRMASCSKDKSIIIWNITNFETIKYLYGHLGPVISLTLIDDQYLASGSCDKTILIWNLNNYTINTILKGHSDCINVLSYYYKSKFIISGSNDNTVILWNSQTFTYNRTLPKFNDSIISLTNSDHINCKQKACLDYIMQN